MLMISLCNFLRKKLSAFIRSEEAMLQKRNRVAVPKLIAMAIQDGS
ncbi:MAG: hypothetical protein ABSD42_04205 [Candidatus Bathyarchaeia archaeon]|jgi:hypothetical protein